MQRGVGGRLKVPGKHFLRFQKNNGILIYRDRDTRKFYVLAEY
jgi:hypothetical protein